MFRPRSLLWMCLAFAAGACDTLDLENEPACQVCGRPVHAATYYKIHLREKEPIDVCCPRCGIRLQQEREDVVQAEVADFETGRRLDARTAVYVENSNVQLCCREGGMRRDQAGKAYSLSWDRCLPSLVAFSNREQASKFAREKGGVVRSYDELTAESP